MPRDLLTQLAMTSGEHLLAIDTHSLALWGESGATRAAADPARSPPSAVAIVPLQGPLTPRGIRFFGYTIAPGMDAFRAALAKAAADPNVAAIVIDCDSPGGTVAGTPETANAVRVAAQAKPVIAMIDTLCASAAYYIASQASEVVITPSGECGSIGVLAVHMDYSRQLEQDGVTATIMRSRPGKADANPYEPLSDEAKAAIQASVDAADADFLKAVAQGRNTTVANVRETFGAGRCVSAKDAVKLGMADRISTMSDVLSGMIKAKAPTKRRSALAFL